MSSDSKVLSPCTRMVTLAWVWPGEKPTEPDSACPGARSSASSMLTAQFTDEPSRRSPARVMTKV